MEPQEKSAVRQRIDSFLNTLSVLEKIEPVLEPSAFPGISDDKIEFWPTGTDESRRIVGGLIRLLKTKPEIRKWGATELEAAFTWNGVRIVINRYRGKKCAVIKKQIVHEAVPEQIIPAKEAYVEEVEELVCEMPDVEAEVTPALEPVAEAPF